MRIGIGLSLIVMLWLPVFPSDSGGDISVLRLPREGVVRMELSEYLRYLETHPPLDLLFRVGDNCYFLKEGLVSAPQGGGGRDSFSAASHLAAASGHGDGDLNGIYHNCRETEERLRDLAASYPDITSLFSIGRSIEGRELFVMKISDNPQVDEAGEEPNIYIVGCHHAREWISVEVPLYFIRYLLENYTTHPQVRRAVEGAQIFIQPIQNPDGLEFSIHTYRYWRQNRRYNGDLSWGVDPNRNYGFEWG